MLIDTLIKPEFLNIRAAELVLERFGMPTFMPSLGTVDERSLLNIEGIPTWHYGTEPSNVFATWHAKFFFNDVREEVLFHSRMEGSYMSRVSDVGNLL